ncbi:MAG: FG-GAP repeat domain-containing protein [Candidatus Aminicenantales bacterium]
MKNKHILDSWKEIANYLKRDVRTCQRWEKHFGLPIHRLEDAPKSRVFAYKEEIDKWLELKLGEKKIRRNHLLLRQIPQLALFLTIVLLALLFLWLIKLVFISPAGNPTDFKIIGSKLIIIDDHGKPLWEYETGISNLESEAYYRRHFQKKILVPDDIFLPQLIFDDINNNHRQEILFSIQTVNETNEGQLICFNNKGKILWTFRAGRRMTFGQKEYSADYRLTGVGCEDIDHDGQKEIIVIAHHNPYFPCQVVLLNSEGKLLGEYWNSGYLQNFAFVDLNGDGRKEVILAGLNNEWRCPCAVVLDSALMKGASPQTKDYYRCKNINASYEKYYLRFPRNEVDLLKRELNNIIHRIEVLENKTILLCTSVSSVFYEFNYNLELLNIDLSHSFMTDYYQFKKEGKIKKSLDEIQQDILKRGVFYFDGHQWTKKTTMTNYWRQLDRNLALKSQNLFSKITLYFQLVRNFFSNQRLTSVFLNPKDW